MKDWDYMSVTPKTAEEQPLITSKASGESDEELTLFTFEDVKIIIPRHPETITGREVDMKYTLAPNMRTGADVLFRVWNKNKRYVGRQRPGPRWQYFTRAKPLADSDPVPDSELGERRKRETKAVRTETSPALTPGNGLDYIECALEEALLSIDIAMSALRGIADEYAAFRQQAVEVAKNRDQLALLEKLMQGMKDPRDE